MWTASIKEKNIANGILTVNVEYSNGISAFNEVYLFRSGPELNAQIINRINQLDSLDDYASSLKLGTYIPTIDSPTQNPKLVALNDLQEAKRLVDLGILPDTDPTYIDALTAAQEAYK